MSVRKVLKIGNPLLRKISEDVREDEINTKDFKKLLRDMFDTMKHENGVGLAAPQIGVLKKVVVVGQESERYDENTGMEPHIIINPVITELAPPGKGFWEGCLSVPGMRGLVQRPNKIKMEWYDEKWNFYSQELDGFRAIVYQHECDHLFGVLYVDKLQDPKLFGFVDSLPDTEEVLD
ncbi:MAG: peptide deformylase [Spirochaetota bacterium]